MAGVSMGIIITILVLVILFKVIPPLLERFQQGADLGLGLETVDDKRQSELKEKYGQLSAENILFNEEIQSEDKKFLLRSIHKYTFEEADELYSNYEARKQKARLRLTQRKIAQKADELFDTMPQANKREPIPEDVTMFVWRRDGGKCVKCGSQEKLHFDHIIPHSKGGSDTERNLQLLCEACNLEKSDKI